MTSRVRAGAQGPRGAAGTGLVNISAEAVLPGSDLLDCSDAIVSVLSRGAGKRVLFDKVAGRSVYRVTSRAAIAFMIESGTRLEFELPVDFSDIGPPTVDGDRKTFFRAEGSLSGTTTSLASDATIGTDVLSFGAGMVAARGYQVGDWLLLKSLDKFPRGYAQGFTAEQVLIKAIDGDDIQLAWAVSDTYLVASTATVAKITHVEGVEIHNPLIIGTGRPTSIAGDSGIGFNWAANCHIRGGEFTDVDYNGVRILNGIHCTVRDLTTYAPAPGANTNVQYGVSIIDASQDCEVSSCLIFGGKHGIAGSVSSGGVQRRLLIANNRIFDTWSSCSAVHENAERVTWVGNEGTRCNSGFDVRCAYAHLEANKLVDVYDGNEGIGLEISRRTLELSSIDNDFGGGRFGIRMASIGYQLSGSEGPARIRISGGRSVGASTRAIDLTLDALNNGQVTSDFGWTHDGNWDFESTQVGSTLATGFRHTTGSTTTLSQAVTLLDGETYRLTFTIFDRSAGTVTPRLTGGTTVTGTARSTDGTYTEDFTVIGNTGFEFVPSSTFDGIVDRIALYRLADDGSILHYDLQIVGFTTNESAGVSILVNGPFAEGRISGCTLNGIRDEPAPQTSIQTINVQDFLVDNNVYGNHAAPSLGGTNVIGYANREHGDFATSDIPYSETVVTSDSTVDVPRWAKRIEMRLHGPGGSGGSGRSAAGAAFGGGGGGGGGRTNVSYLLSDLAKVDPEDDWYTLVCVIGQAGAVGAGATGGDGATASAGSNTTVSDGNGTLALAGPGSPGTGGTAGSGTGGAGGIGSQGGNSGATSSTSATPSAGNSSIDRQAAAGGGAGGGKNGSETPRAGSDGGTGYSMGSPGRASDGGDGGAATGAAGADGDPKDSAISYGAGGGGGGGGANASGDGGDGGDGGIPGGGGGGGGACAAANASGDGGLGGRGEIVLRFFAQ